MPSTPRRVFPRPSFLSPPLLALAGAVPSIVQAQAPATPATPEACVSINVDADRLACYDATLGRGARDTRGADIAAKEARAIQKNLELAEDVVPEAATAAPTGTGELYPHDDPQLAQAIANAGKGSLLDSRWELAKDSKLGMPLDAKCVSSACLESPYSARAKANLGLNLDAARLLLDGCGAGYAGLGFDDLLASIGADNVAATMRSQLPAARAALDAIEEPDLGLAFAQDPASVEALHGAIGTLTTTLKTMFVTVLGFDVAGIPTDND